MLCAFVHLCAICSRSVAQLFTEPTSSALTENMLTMKPRQSYDTLAVDDVPVLKANAGVHGSNSFAEYVSFGIVFVSVRLLSLCLICISCPGYLATR